MEEHHPYYGNRRLAKHTGARLALLEILPRVWEALGADDNWRWIHNENEASECLSLPPHAAKSKLVEHFDKIDRGQRRWHVRRRLPHNQRTPGTE